MNEILIELDRNGSFAGTFGHMNEDLGMLAGAYGLRPEDERILMHGAGSRSKGPVKAVTGWKRMINK